MWGSVIRMGIVNAAILAVLLLIALIAASPLAAQPRDDAMAFDAETALATTPDAATVAQWVAGSADNRGLPYIIIDKQSAALFVFDGKRRLRGTGPVLIGRALGDAATPGVGNKRLAEIGPAEKTTPAGRFLAKYGLAAGGARVLWVDYADAVALHPIPSDASPRERRRARMLSPTPEDNRITFGCINVPARIYALVRPLFARRGGYVYVLPDSKPIEDVFPGVRTVMFAGADLTAAR